MCTGGLSGYSHTHPGGRTAEPIDAVFERLNDPAVAAAVVTLFDNAEILSTLDAMNDADVQRGLGFMAEIVRTIGRNLE